MSKNNRFEHKAKVVFLIVAFIVLSVQVVFILSGYEFPLLKTSGQIAERQKDLIILTASMSLIVIIPVFYMLFSFISKYQEDKSSEYKPEQDNNKVIEVIWWGVPIILITILGIVTFKTSHSLDPFKAIAHDKPALKVQVVALPWKWLFLYPEEKIATVNYLKIPVDRPVEFSITSDAPMNSFWIPDLGGQVYAMSGMQTELNLIADKAGEYRGMSANLSGEGFESMKFVTSAVDETDFHNWVANINENSDHKHFDQQQYNDLVKPSKDAPSLIYHLHDSDIFQNSIDKYMSHGTNKSYGNDMEQH